MYRESQFKSWLHGTGVGVSEYGREGFNVKERLPNNQRWWVRIEIEREE